MLNSPITWFFHFSDVNLDFKSQRLQMLNLIRQFY